jgi:AP-1 complex subunit beta-1
MSYINVDKVTDHISDPLRACLKDQDAYVRKTAAIAIVKLYFTDRRLIMNEGLLDDLRSLLNDSNPTVCVKCISFIIRHHYTVLRLPLMLSLG